MSVSGFFGKKARALAAAFAIAVGAGGGAYVAHERTQPVESQFTQAGLQNVKGANEETLFNGRLPLFTSMDAASKKAQAKTVADMTGAIDAMERMKAGLDPETAGALQTAAVDFVNNLRLSENLTERDYTKLLKDYQTRVGIDVSAQAGNYAQNVRIAQECSYAVHFAAIWDFDDEEVSPADQAKEIGACMAESGDEAAQYAKELDDKDGMKSELAGGAAGAALGGLLILPAAIRRRRTPPIQKGFRG
ncbi:MAG: hypothetical protein ACAH80_04020 [Alphaproteobacteria bacterium]